MSPIRLKMAELKKLFTKVHSDKLLFFRKQEDLKLQIQTSLLFHFQDPETNSSLRSSSVNLSIHMSFKKKH